MNESPESFDVIVSEVFGTMADLEWNEATDPDGDRVTYTVWLNGEKVQTNLSETKIKLQGLEAESSYAGKVVATDSKDGLSESVFSFNTSEITIEWKRSFGGSNSDFVRAIKQTEDGGYIVAGHSASSDGDVGENYGGSDFWIIRLDNNGNLIWETNLGGSGSDIASSIQNTTDGGYIVAGHSSSTDGDVKNNHGGVDCWIVKLNASGSLVWETSLGGSGDDRAASVQQTDDEGYIVTGYSASSDGDVGGNHGGIDFWVVKLDVVGSLVWETNLGGTDHDQATSILQTMDGEYIVAGASRSLDGDVNGNKGLSDYWIVKLGTFGDIIWETGFGGSGNDFCSGIQQTVDKGYILAGYSLSSDGDVGHNFGSRDYWIVKLDASGALMWETNLGGSHYDVAYAIQQTHDGGFITVGQSESGDWNVNGNNGDHDYWVVKLDNSGDLIWEANLGGSLFESASAVQQTLDLGYIVAGASRSSDGEVGGNKGFSDFWIVKLK